MNPETIIAELRRINAWRRGGEEIEQPDPKHIGEVLDAAADSLASLIASNTTLRRERSEARNQIAELAKVTAERNDWKIRAEEMDGYKADCMALRARVAELEALLSSEKATRNAIIAKGLAAEQRVAELEAGYRDLRVAYEQNASQCVQLNRELGLKIDTVEWLNGTAIQRERAEQAEARVKELEASRDNALRERTEAIEQGARDARRADKNAVANAELQKQEAESRRLFYAEQDKRQSAEQRNAELEAEYRDLRVAYEQNASQCVQLNRELKIDTVEWLNGTAIQRDRAEKAEARIAELVAALRETLDDPNSTISGALYYRMEQVLARAESGVPDHIRDAAQMVPPAKEVQP